MPVEWKENTDGWEQHYRIDDDGTFHRSTMMDAEPVLNAAKEAHNNGAGSSVSGDLKWAASIPMGIYLKWKMEDGVDICQPGTDGWLRRKLDDPEYAHLRIWKGRLGKHHE